jgi:hypothetical protein
MLDKRIYKWFRRLIEMGLSLVALGIVLQILFGGNVTFLPGDIIGSIAAKVAHLGGYGLAGVVVGGGIFWLFIYAGVWREESKVAEDATMQSAKPTALDKSRQTPKR